MILDPNNPVYNTIIIYIAIMFLVLMYKPSFLFCHKTNKFKSFGFDKNNTLIPFPYFVVLLSFLLYMMFLCISILSKYLEN